MSRWMYSVAWKNENGKKRQKEFVSRDDAEDLIKQIRAKGQPYTFGRFCRMRWWDRLWLAKVIWRQWEIPVRWVLAGGLTLAAPLALWHHFR